MKIIYILLVVMNIVQFALNVCMSIICFINGGTSNYISCSIWAFCAVCWLTSAVVNAMIAKNVS